MAHAKKASATARGMGYAHQQTRKALLPYAYGTPCPICGNEMQVGQALDLDHEIPRSLGGVDGPKRMTHASCNRSRGNGTKKSIVQQPTTRAW